MCYVDSIDETYQFVEHSRQEININWYSLLSVTFFADNDAVGSFENLSYVGNLGIYDSIYFKKCTQKIFEQYTQVWVNMVT